MLKTRMLLLLSYTPLPPQDPVLMAVEPAKGPAAGGTVITIYGNDLDTATKEDVSVTVGRAPCKV